MNTKIGRNEAKNGNSYAITKFSNKISNERSDPEQVHLREKVRDRPLLLGELDNQVQAYIKQLRLSGGIVSSSIVVVDITSNLI